MLPYVFEYNRIFVCPQSVFLQMKAGETSLDTAKRELDTFQWEKQQRLNELCVVVPLKLHQVIQDVLHLQVQNGLCTSKQWCYCSLGPLVPDSLQSPGSEVSLIELCAAISSRFFFSFSYTDRKEVRTGRSVHCSNLHSLQLSYRFGMGFSSGHTY